MKDYEIPIIIEKLVLVLGLFMGVLFMQECTPVAHANEHDGGAKGFHRTTDGNGGQSHAITKGGQRTHKRTVGAVERHALDQYQQRGNGQLEQAREYHQLRVPYGGALGHDTMAEGNYRTLPTEGDDHGDGAYQGRKDALVPETTDVVWDSHHRAVRMANMAQPKSKFIR